MTAVDAPPQPRTERAAAHLAAAPRPAAVGRARRRRLRLVPAAVHQHRRRLDVGARHDLDRGRVLLLAARSGTWRPTSSSWSRPCPGMTLRQATVSTETTTAVSNTVVGGAAISLGLTYAMNSSWGFSRSRTSVIAAGVGAVEQLRQARAAGARAGPAGLLRPADAPAGCSPALLGVAALVAAVVLLGLLLRSAAAAARIGTTARRGSRRRCGGRSAADR